MGPGNRAHLAAVLVVVLVLAACGGNPRPTAGRATTTTPHASVSHSARELEARLPGEVEGHPLQKGSATGAVVLSGSDAFSRVLRRSLAAVGRRPSDLSFANARDPTRALDLEVGVFRVRGLAAAALRDAIVRSSRPNAPGLAVSHVVLGGVPVTRLVYPGGSTLYLDAGHGVVYYVGTQNAALAARLVRRLP